MTPARSRLPSPEMAAPVETRRLRRSGPQRVLLAVNSVVVASCVLLAGVGGYFFTRLGEIPTIDLSEHLGQGDDQATDRPLNFLIVGNDSREFAADDEADADAFGGDQGPDRTDTMIIVRVDPNTNTASMLSLPRDLWVPISGTDGSQRLNTAIQGGEGRLIDTIKDQFGISIDHYLAIDFKAFRDLVDAIGGVTIYLASPVRDGDGRTNPTGLDIQETGCVELDGDTALAYVRSRNFQQYVNGRWQADPTGDLGRIQRQQDFVRTVLHQVAGSNLLSLTNINRLVNVAVDNITVDSALGKDEILALAKQFRSLSPEALTSYSLPVVNGTEYLGGQRASVLYLDSSKRLETESIFDVFRGVTDEPPTVEPSAVTVRVLNGSGRSGEAGTASAALSQIGFSVATVGDGTRSARTTVRYGEGQEDKARLLASYLEQGADLVADPTLEGVDVVLTTGTDFTAVAVPATAEDPAPADTTATTAAPATPSTTTPAATEPSDQC